MALTQAQEQALLQLLAGTGSAGSTSSVKPAELRNASNSSGVDWSGSGGSSQMRPVVRINGTTVATVSLYQMLAGALNNIGSSGNGLPMPPAFESGWSTVGADINSGTDRLATVKRTRQYVAGVENSIRNTITTETGRLATSISTLRSDTNNMIAALANQVVTGSRSGRKLAVAFGAVPASHGGQIDVSFGATFKGSVAHVDVSLWGDSQAAAQVVKINTDGNGNAIGFTLKRAFPGTWMAVGESMS